MPDYSKGKIYTIRKGNDDTLIYVGSTVQPLHQRFSGHKIDSMRGHHSLLFDEVKGDWNDWYIELYENYPCENREQLCKREGEIIREIGATLNKNIAGRNKQEYYKDNIDKIKEQRKVYYQDNTDKKKAYHKDYYQKNTDKIKERERKNYIEKADKIRAYQNEYMKQYKIDNADKMKAYSKDYYQKNKKK